MPWDVIQRNGEWVVLDKGGKVLGTHKTKKSAREQQKALYASEARSKR